jgi:hypothetical protein
MAVRMDWRVDAAWRDADPYTHRAATAELLAPWFSRRTLADLAVAFAGTSVPWARLHNPTDRVSTLSRRTGTKVWSYAG